MRGDARFLVLPMARVRRRRHVTPQAFRGGATMWIANVCLLLASLAYVYAVKNTAPANAAQDLSRRWAPRWQPTERMPFGFEARHPAGL